MKWEISGLAAALGLLVASKVWAQAPDPTGAQPSLIIVVGAAGTPEYEEAFGVWSGRWAAAAREAKAQTITIGDGPTTNAWERLRTALADQPKSNEHDLWLVLIGHGTFDGSTAKFNLRGRDLTPEDLSDWLSPFNRRQVLVNTASASAPFLSRLSGTNRVIVSATRNGDEQNFCHLGDYLSLAINDARADLDRDGQISILEAFLTAAAEVRDFYQREKRLLTEHALIDDNGDRLGTPGDWFAGLRATKKPVDNAQPDGRRARQCHLVGRPEALDGAARRARDELELQIAALRDEKPKLSEEDYYGRLETLLLRLGRLYVKDDPGAGASAQPAPPEPKPGEKATAPPP